MLPLSSTVLGVLAARWLRRRARHRRLERDNREASARAEDELALPKHLSPGLRRVAHGAHTLGLILDEPIRRAPDPLMAELPWVRRAHCDEYDLAMTDIRRAVWEWLKEVERLSEPERRRLGELGLSPRPFRRLLYASLDRTDDPWEEVVWAKTPNFERIAAELAQVRTELQRFQSALLGPQVAPYRGVA